VAVEVYGGPLFNSWLDRDLGLSGRVALRDGDLHLVKIDRPIARIPQLAIHLDRDVNTSGLVLNPQQHLTPMWAIEDGEFEAFIAEELGVPRRDIAFWDLMFHDLTPSSLLGRKGRVHQRAAHRQPVLVVGRDRGVDRREAGGPRERRRPVRP